MSKAMTDEPVFRLVLQDPESDRLAVGRFGDGTVVLCTSAAGVALRGVAVEDLISALDGGRLARELEEARQELGRLRARDEQQRNEADAVDPVRYLLWSGKHQAWWRPDARGYTPTEREAGRYTRAEAVDHVIASAQCGVRDQVTSMVATPETWDAGLSTVPVVLAVDPGVQVKQAGAEADPHLADPRNDRYMMATTAHHKTGDISRDEPDLAIIYGYGETETDYVGQWVAGLGLINVRFPKATTRELTAAEREHYRGMLIDEAGAVRPIVIDEPQASADRPEAAR